MTSTCSAKIPDNFTAMNNPTKAGYIISKSGIKIKNTAAKKHNLEVCDGLKSSVFFGCQSPLTNRMIGAANEDPLAYK